MAASNRDDAAMLQADGLSVSYGKVRAVEDVSLTVGRGRIVTVIGPNGAGKTTLLSALMGLLPSQGGIRFAGQRYAHPDVQEMVSAGMNLVPEKRELFLEMSVEDNLVLGAFHRRRHRDHLQDLEAVYGLFPRLRERRKQLTGTLSGGERQMVAIGRALMGRPALLMLDEPSLGLAPLIVKEIFRIVQTLRERGVSILLVEQNARAALRIADYAYVLEMGRVTVAGPAADVAADPRVTAIYLGKAGGEGQTCHPQPGAVVAPGQTARVEQVGRI
ncbi:ABC transporter ATP-binding protein [Robbsia andropogonis]|uniref:ABC transporter ATP-binding protein n=2 Tax=Robbsia andropogonis TaxID=28092 RepID=UPI0004644803|nr:ABC transporter ATP-binding protein [Robbsia andropogonis]MCP1116851.1 ABC transporter ATP-binding protein [Robbsia andropogonis]MCP1126470.1 ABC transporter ATP-binding protein [Robbsia andropogonis]